MATFLEGGCFVVDLLPAGGHRPDDPHPIIHTLIDRVRGTAAISLRALWIPAGASLEVGNGECDEVLYVIEGNGTARSGDTSWPLRPDAGLFLAPGRPLAFAAGDAPLVVASSRCPDPGAEQPKPPDQQHHSSDAPLPVPVHLDSRHRETTADRWYCVMVNEEAGSRVSQFVGSIPPGRAKDHFHHYEEVLVILRGQGRMWAGKTSTPIGPGSCIFLPSRQVHCVENTGEGELRLLGVFYPAGSPAVRYDTESSP